MAIPRWFSKDTKVDPTRWHRAGVWGNFITAKGEVVPYTYGACFAGWINHKGADTFKEFHLKVIDRVTPDGVKSNTAYDWVSAKAREMGFKFRRRGEYVIMDTTVMSGREMWLLGNMFRNLWEGRAITLNFMFLSKKHPEIDPIRLYILAHNLSYLEDYLQTGHSWLTQRLSYFKRNDHTNFLKEVRKVFNMPYCKFPSYYLLPTDRLKVDSITNDILEGSITHNRNTFKYSEEAFYSFFSKEEYESFCRGPLNTRRGGW